MKRNKGSRHGQCDVLMRVVQGISKRMRSPLHLCTYHLAMSSNDTSVDRSPTLVPPVRGATHPTSKQELFGAANDWTKKMKVLSSPVLRAGC